MNIYVVVEGEIGEKLVYQEWISVVNPQLSYVSRIGEIQKNNFSILAGLGYPQYFKVIENAIQDVKNHGNIDRLVVAVDAEEMTFEEKYDEVRLFLDNLNPSVPVSIIVQNFCLETWALGNIKVVKKSPKSIKLREYKNLYNVRELDPEGLPRYDNLSRIRFAELYLRVALNERYRNLTYKKGKPDALMHPKYFQEIKNRFESTNHIKSFKGFLEAFSE